MSIELADGAVERLSGDGVTTQAYVDHVAETLDGKRVVVDCSDPQTGLVYAAE
jgi:hypothetical protein